MSETAHLIPGVELKPRKPRQLLVKLSDVACVLGVGQERLQGMAKRGDVHATKLVSARRGPKARGLWYVTMDEANRLLRLLMEPGRTRRAANRALLRASHRLEDSVHAVGLRPATPLEAGKPVSDALLDP